MSEPRDEPYSADDLREGDREPVESDRWRRAPEPGTVVPGRLTDPDAPTQFEQENDLGRGGGEVDDETMRRAERAAEERRGGDRPGAAG